MKITIADASIHHIWYVTYMNIIEILRYKFTVPTIYKHESGLPLILGNNFLRLYHPFCQYLNYITVKTPIMTKYNKKKCYIKNSHSFNMVKR